MPSMTITPIKLIVTAKKTYPPLKPKNGTENKIFKLIKIATQNKIVNK